jgi:hypothetical protein
MKEANWSVDKADEGKFSDFEPGGASDQTSLFGHLLLADNTRTAAVLYDAEQFSQVPGEPAAASDLFDAAYSCVGWRQGSLGDLF